MNNKEFIGIIFNNWAGLKMCIEHGMAGPNLRIINEKLEYLIDEIVEFIQTNDNEEDLEDLIADIMDDKFNTILEDDSIINVAKDILFYKRNADINILDRFRIKESILSTSNKLTITKRMDDAEVENIYNEDERMSDDDDGWTLVKKK